MRPLSVQILRLSACTLGCSLVSALAPSVAWAADPIQNIAYGGNMQADLYIPDSAADPTALVVSLHYCGGSKSNALPWFKSDADRLGFSVLTPQAGGSCFDAAAARSGERAEIVAMVDWAVQQHGVDPKRVYAAGASSGACMTHALLAAYPEVFAAGSSLAGVPAGAWTSGNTYSSPKVIKTAQQWGDLVRNLNPGFTGPWPRMQIWHGDGDTNLNFIPNYAAEVDEWTNVWGFTEADGMNEMIKPPGAKDTWDRTSYVDSNGVLGVEANHAEALVMSDQHDLTGSGLWGDVVRFFAPDMVPPDPGTGGTNGSGGGGAAAGGSGAGGASTGGTNAGGGPASGGSNSGGASAGGAVGTGGAPSGSGGAIAAVGGSVGAGGTVGAGGAVGTGGTVGAGGAVGSGGTTTASGGASGPGEPAGGCSIVSGAHTSPRSLWGLLVAVAFGLALGRRRARRSSPTV